jgi:hypothetical protein
MRVVITIFDCEFIGRPNVKTQVNSLCDIKEIVDATLYLPKAGMLADFMELLRLNNIRYYPGVYFAPPLNE